MTFSTGEGKSPRAAAPVSTARRRISFAWLGVVPFLLFALLFLILPTMKIVIGSFQTNDGGFTLANIANLFQPSILAAYWISIKISVASALLGCFFGFLLAWAMVLGGLPGWLRSPILTFSGVASNFAGIPLAFAFLATFGRLGLVRVCGLDGISELATDWPPPADIVEALAVSGTRLAVADRPASPASS